MTFILPWIQHNPAHLFTDQNMSAGYSQTPRIMELAQQLEADIRHRQLKPGDPYLSLTQAARSPITNTSGWPGSEPSGSTREGW